MPRLKYSRCRELLFRGVRGSKKVRGGCGMFNFMCYGGVVFAV